ncbi:MAG: aminomethyl-transferring glycine dehydrogenase subunit GcvPB [Clostridia bacterium]|jgi:glycine dehydrogenase subunit 2|nr:aminomethyl-transferring glycine dehydrogenase subunit GcvPB [Clostridia bacterium]HPB17332.1 aminomethyl-transferring glycine dehydrogenase subunit GcvPB [Clostridia bacterium]HQO70190.1 aminomethyl-transferring glycine dehydrogenase subunit GcvPB [Clostridia bacterium]
MAELIFDLSKEGKCAFSLPQSHVPSYEIDEMYTRKDDAQLPQVSEVDVIRHFTNISRRNYGVDQGFYPLGSCTMKYNPKLNEDVARLPGLNSLHPYQPEYQVQGALEAAYELTRYLCEITGMSGATLQPAAGAHGEMTGIMIIKAYHQSRNDYKRTKMIVPDSAHGTNPASAATAGYEVVQVKSDEKGLVDINALSAMMDDETAGLMLTNPNTLGLFESNITKIAKIVHDKGGLLYYDGANLNAIMGIARPFDMGFDVVHLNLHKTMSTPHGGGGPGSGPVCVREDLTRFLPKPVICKKGESYYLDYDRKDSIGRVRAFYGNYLVYVRALSYILTMGPEGLKSASETAVLNANYIMAGVKDNFVIPYDRFCMHEFVLSGIEQKEKYGVSTLDMAKRLLDYGYHPPTIYFPMIVHEGMMIEPTETESKETLDEFIGVLNKIAKEAKEDAQLLHDAPHNTYVRRLDEVTAARNPILKWEKEQDE